MADGEYQVVFNGELTGEHPEETVKQRLADLFGMPAQRIDALFAGKPVVVKKDVDRNTAERFDRTFRRAGAVCEIRRPSDGGPEAVAASGDSDGASGARSGEQEGSERGAASMQAAGAEAHATGGAGATIAAGDPNRTVVDLDVPTSFDGLALDDSGGPLSEGERPEPPAIDTTELGLADDAAPLDPGEPPAPAEIDTSGLSMEPLDDT